MKIRAIVSQEIPYVYAQSQENIIHCGLIGYLRGDFGKSGFEFWSTWFDGCTELKTVEFQSEFDLVVNNLRSNQYGGILKDVKCMKECCRRYAGEIKTFCRCEYGLRIDTARYAYLLRLLPYSGTYNFYLYAYQSDLLEKHLEDA